LPTPGKWTRNCADCFAERTGASGHCPWRADGPRPQRVPQEHGAGHSPTRLTFQAAATRAGSRSGGHCPQGPNRLRANSRIVSADVRRRRFPRKEVPPRYLGGYVCSRDSRIRPAIAWPALEMAGDPGGDSQSCNPCRAFPQKGSEAHDETTVCASDQRLSTTRACPSCGSLVSDDALEGLCPDCLGRLALGATQVSGSEFRVPSFGAETALTPPEPHPVTGHPRAELRSIRREPDHPNPPGNQIGTVPILLAITAEP
jgi:hypothetical protein